MAFSHIHPRKVNSTLSETIKCESNASDESDLCVTDEGNASASTPGYEVADKIRRNTTTKQYVQHNSR